MRHLERIQKPQILISKEVEWSQKFISSGNSRPASRTYNHPEIKETLGNISYKKCFYSEYKFTHLTEAQIDHAIEVTEDKNKAFEWDNLYLSHKDCNQGKITNAYLPCNDCLDPFIDSDHVIEDSLDFEDELMLGKNSKGLNTIRKFGLNKDIFIHLRAKELQKYYRLLEAILVSIQQNNNKTEMSELDKESLRSFGNPDKPFSLMFKKSLLRLPL